MYKKMQKINYTIKMIFFLMINFIGCLLLPTIKEMRFRNVKIIPYNKKYLNDLNNIFKSWKQNINISKKNIYLLNIFGKKLCFLMIDENEKLIGFIFLYFSYNDIKNRRIHSAFACMQSNYRGCGYGALLFIFALNWFTKIKWIKGISSRFAIDNNLSRKLHEKVGFKIIKKYFDEYIKKEKAYAICDFANSKYELNKYYQKLKYLV